MLRTSASVLLTSLVMAGCSGGAIQLPASSKILDDLPRVENATKSPCWQQEQIAAQNSYLATIKAGKDVVYKAPCRIDKPQRAPAPKVASHVG